MYKIILPIVFGLFFLGLAVFFLGYGIKGGFIDKKILSHFPNIYATGDDAMKRGSFYIFLGLIALGGSLISFVSIYKKYIS